MPPLPQNQAKAAGDEAIVIGISSYPRLGRDFKPDDLNGPGNDARAFTHWLVDYAGLDCANIRCFISDGCGTCSVLDGAFTEAFVPLSERPNKYDIESLIDKLTEDAITAPNGKRRKGRRLWIYVAAHGFRPANAPSEVCILPANTYHDTYPRHFTITSWVNRLSLCGAFDEIVMFMDCCSTYAYGMPPDGAPLLTDQGVPRSARLFVAATGADRQTFETADPSGQVGGVFTRNLLRGLGGEAPHVGNVLTSKHLKDYLHNSVGAGGAGDHEGDPEFLVSDNIELLYFEPRAEKLRKVPIGWPPGTRTTITGSDLAPVGHPVVTAAGEAEFRLLPGFYKLTAPGQPSRLFEVKGDRELAEVSQ